MIYEQQEQRHLSLMRLQSASYVVNNAQGLCALPTTSVVRTTCNDLQNQPQTRSRGLLGYHSLTN